MNDNLLIPLALAVSAYSAGVAAQAQLPEIVVVEAAVEGPEVTTVLPEVSVGADTATLLRRVPGANVNSNGPLTGIAQYRGTFGNRVSVVVDGAVLANGGPNSMDSPLSYVPNGLLRELRVTRGIVSVSAGQETLGGHIEASMRNGSFATGADVDVHSEISTSYSGLNDGISASALVYGANQHHKVAVSASYDNGNDSHYEGDNVIEATEYDRSRYNLHYGYQNDTSEFSLTLGRNETDVSGTPALPMDILYIDSDIATANFATAFDEVTFSGHLSYSHADHLMDNFSLRQAPASPMRFRSTHATGRTLDYALQANLPLLAGELAVGVDVNESIHNADVANPNNPLFAIRNFNDPVRNTYGLFGEWVMEDEDRTLELGLRFNRVSTDADPVSASGMMGMMGNGADALAAAFNSGDRSETFNNTDWVVKYAQRLRKGVGVHLGLARKSRAPSYQEHYLWLPMQSTGGLADGRSYIGNLDLDSEVAHEINLGLSLRSERLVFSPEIFYREIDDYIQGTPTANVTANQVSTMMSGNPALQFNNVDAEIYGIDTFYRYQLSDLLHLEGHLSYVRGKRTDVSDNLYRIAPLNGRIGLTYRKPSYSVTLESEFYAGQSDVAAFNNEEKTAGYGLVNLRAFYDLNEQVTLSGGIDNLFDKTHRNHLAGYNRVAGGDLALGDRLYGTGINIYGRVSYRF
ncbi:TonB-dependent receptor domain-containing protein [Exilibacterium tricleocarpae]|nr:TonB-dependent receptor [Exilibacterium tricleocarpae]